MPIIPEEELKRSPIVANCRMNRKRKLIGINSYEKELGFNIEEFLLPKAQINKGAVHWLDICCGEGNALIELGKRLYAKQQANKISLTGIDLVGMFSGYAFEEIPKLQLIETAIENWQPTQTYDLITCIHGLHYIGDKLGIIQKIGNMLTADGLFIGNLALDNLLNESGSALSTWLKNQWAELGWQYNSRRKLLTITGRTDWPICWEYLGADDQAGPNYTGQEVVNSFYKINSL